VQRDHAASADYMFVGRIATVSVCNIFVCPNATSPWRAPAHMAGHTRAASGIRAAPALQAVLDIVPTWNILRVRAGARTIFLLVLDFRLPGWIQCGLRCAMAVWRAQGGWHRLGERGRVGSDCCVGFWARMYASGVVRLIRRTCLDVLDNRK